MRYCVSLVMVAVAFEFLKGPAHAQPLVYVSDVHNNAVMIYLQAGERQAPIGEITMGINAPAGLAVDAQGTLYVANARGGNVTAYAAGSRRPTRTYSLGLRDPFGVCVGSDGTLFVSDFDGNLNHGAIVEYLRGSTVPFLTIRGFGPQGPGFCAVSPGDDLFLIPSMNVPSQIDEVRPRSSVAFNIGAVLEFGTGLAVDGNGNLIVADFLGPGVLVYPPRATNPSRMIAGGMIAPYQIAFNAAKTDLYVVQDAVGPPQPVAAVTVLSYPAGRVVNTISAGLRQPLGVALSP